MTTVKPAAAVPQDVGLAPVSRARFIAHWIAPASPDKVGVATGGFTTDGADGTPGGFNSPGCEAGRGSAVITLTVTSSVSPARTMAIKTTSIAGRPAMYCFGRMRSSLPAE